MHSSWTNELHPSPCLRWDQSPTLPAPAQKSHSRRISLCLTALGRAIRILLTLHHDCHADSGVGRVTRELAAGYRDLGHTVDVFSFEDLPDRLTGKGRWMAFPWAVDRLLRSSGPWDVVDASTGDLWVHASRRRQTPGPLLVTRSHGLETVNRRRLIEAGVPDTGSVSGQVYHHRYRLWEVRRSLRVSDAVLVLNEEERREAQSLGVPDDRIATIGHGIGEHLLGLPAPNPTAAPLRLAYLGTHGPLKGSPTVLAALRVLLGENDGRRATLLGTRVPTGVVLTDLPEALRARVDVVPDFDNRDLPGLLADHHVLLAPALAEGFGLGILEAMACGLVPIVGSAPGPRRIVTDGVDGLMLDDPTPDDLVREVRGLDGDRDRLARLRTAAHERAQRATWRTSIERQVALVEKWRDELLVSPRAQPDRRQPWPPR